MLKTTFKHDLLLTAHVRRHTNLLASAMWFRKHFGSCVFTGFCCCVQMEWSEQDVWAAEWSGYDWLNYYSRKHHRFCLW